MLWADCDWRGRRNGRDGTANGPWAGGLLHGGIGMACKSCTIRHRILCRLLPGSLGDGSIRIWRGGGVLGGGRKSLVLTALRRKRERARARATPRYHVRAWCCGFTRLPVRSSSDRAAATKLGTHTVHDETGLLRGAREDSALAERRTVVSKESDLRETRRSIRYSVLLCWYCTGPGPGPGT